MINLEKFKNVAIDYIHFNKPMSESYSELLDFVDDYEGIDNIGFNILTKDILMEVLNKALNAEINRDDLIVWTSGFIGFSFFEYEEKYSDIIDDTLVLLDQASPSFLDEPNSAVGRYFITDELLNEQIEKLRNAQPETTA